ncbi:MAG: ISNCY family transposase [Dehalococcoidia bacterium]|nr:ISNCY family transposase [Dehalococcoidia bacterium]
MNKKEQKRAVVLGKVDRGEITAAEAGKVVGLSVRHIRRLLARYREEGPRALSHGNRGRKPLHTLDPAIGSRIVELYESKYTGFNHVHFTEKLEGEGINVSYSTVHRILLNSGIKSPRKRRPPKHRKRRERMPQRGMMLQIDGSRHDWLEGRGSWLTLVGGIDDATGEVPHAKFRLQEDAQGYFLFLKHISLTHGLPQSLYSDLHGIFIHKRKEGLTIEEDLKGEPHLTQFGRLLKELEIEPIFALSPQAKGRIERLWGTFQDRLVSELRLAGAKTLEEANEVLEKFLEEYNAKFVTEPAQAGSCYRSLPPRVKLAEIFCFKYERTVANDNTVKLGGRLIQIPPGPGGRSYAKARVEIYEGMDGSLGVYYQGKRIAFEEPVEKDAILRVKHPGYYRRNGSKEDKSIPCKKRIEQTELPKLVKRDPDGVLRPTSDHPWRRFPIVTNSSKN